MSDMRHQQISKWTTETVSYPGAAVSISPAVAEELDRWSVCNDSIEDAEAGGSTP